MGWKDLSFISSEITLIMFIFMDLSLHAKSLAPVIDCCHCNTAVSELVFSEQVQSVQFISNKFSQLVPYFFQDLSYLFLEKLLSNSF